MFINYSNHPSRSWGEEQTKAAKAYGTVVDVPFLDVEPEWTEKEIGEKARDESAQIVKLLEECNDEESAVLCQGECTLCFAIVDSLLKKKLKNVHVVSAVSKRCVTEESCENGVTSKTSHFAFAGFRDYVYVPPKKEAVNPSCFDRDRKESNRDKILIASIGTGGYQNTNYFDPESEDKETITKTGYVFDAVVKKENPNKLILIGTKDSGWKGVIEWYWGKADAGLEETKNYLLQKINEEKPFSKGDWEKLETYIKEAAGFDKVKLVIVIEGATQKDQESYVELLKTALSESIASKVGEEGERKTEIIFDISNGFRSMPLYIMMLVKYIGLIGNQNKANEITYRAYYGMFEAKDKQYRTPLVNMTGVTELTEWINAISEFRNSGSVKALYRCLERDAENKPFYRTEIEVLSKKFREYDVAVNSNNLTQLKKGIDAIKNLEFETMGLSQAAKIMLEDLRQDFRNRFQENSPYPYSKLQVELSKLFTEQQQYVYAAIAIQEGTTTYVMERYLKERIQTAAGLSREDTEEFSKYIAANEHRKCVTPKLNEYVDNKKNEEVLFARVYKSIRDEIRNIGAHQKEAEAVSKEQLEEWLKTAQECIIGDMNDSDIPKMKTGLEELFARFDYKDEKMLGVVNATIDQEIKKLLQTGKIDVEKVKEKFREELEKNQELKCQFERGRIDINKVNTLLEDWYFVQEKGAKSKEKKGNITEQELLEHPIFLSICQRKWEDDRKQDIARKLKGETVTVSDICEKLNEENRLSTLKNYITKNNADFVREMLSF